MFRRILRWLLPLIALLMVATWLVFAPILSSHAAQVTPAAPPHISAPAGSGASPNMRWRPR